MLSLAATKYKQTIVMVTHDKHMAECADRILSIVDGQIQIGFIKKMKGSMKKVIWS